MSSLSLVQLQWLLVCVSVAAAAASAPATLSVDFYPIVDDTYAAPPPPTAPLPHTGYSSEQTYNDYRDGGARSGGGQFSNGGHNSGYLDEQEEKGSSGREALSIYDRALAAQRRKQHDEGYYGDVSAKRAGLEDGRLYHGGQQFGQQARNREGLGNRGGHKKGHTTTGFTNSYHKDETGKKTEFYDSSNDEGDKFVYKGRDEAYDGRGSDVYQGGHHNNLYRADSRGRQGNFGGGYDLADTKGHKNDYGRQEYYDQNRDYNRKSAQQDAKQLGGYYDNGSRHSSAGNTAGYYGGGGGGGGTLGFHGAAPPPAPYPYY
ncbi:keratin, type I cytoskeletal 9-like [Cloeon dipterum]|uniref:keratin, type I cytoskeletal 9-like n=1 Tax=Cloeon dipterum TaxID=197152 RepID=UPI0032201389